MDKDSLLSTVEQGITEIESGEKSTDKELGKLAVEFRKLKNKLEKVNSKLSEDEIKAIEFLTNKMDTIMGNCGIKVTDYVNERWNEGMALLDIVAVEEWEGLDAPIIGQTISPLVEINGKIAQRSKVVIYEPKKKQIELIQLDPKKGLLPWIISIVLFVLLLGVLIFILIHFKNRVSNQLPVEEEIENTVIEEINMEDNEQQNFEEINTELTSEEVNNELTNEEIIEGDITDNNLENADMNDGNTEKNIGELENRPNIEETN